LNIASLLGSLVWLFRAPDWEPLVTSIGLIASLIALIYKDSDGPTSPKMKQKGGDNSRNYQSQGNITINKDD
jgi:hypothetical protein